MSPAIVFDFQNPDDLPVEVLVLKVSNNGIVQNLNALDPAWIVRQNLSHYEVPPSKSTVLGATDAWLAHMTSYLEDLKWLLRMEHHIFWSNIIHYPDCMEMLLSFLQEANPPYMPKHPDKRVWELTEQISKRVMIVFSRLVTNKESQGRWMSKEYLGQIIYDKFIFSIPTLLDLCLVYGVGNKSHMEKLVGTVFQLQPKYINDLEVAVKFCKEVFKYIIITVNKDYDKSLDPPNLPETFRGFREIRRPSDQDVSEARLTFDKLSDIIIYSLDTALTLRLFTEIYTDSVDILKHCGFILSLSHFYENAIPYMYEKLEELGDERNVSYTDTENFIDTTRLELLDIFKVVLEEYKDRIFNEDTNTELRIEDYLSVLMEGLSEKTFTRDYNAIYPVGEDIELLRQAYPFIDSVKTDFILQAVYSTIDDEIPNIPNGSSYYEPKNEIIINRDLTDVGSSCYTSKNEIIVNRDFTDVKTDLNIPDNIRQESLISEVKDIFPDLGDGFVLKCLEHYNYNTAIVINSILEDNLPGNLKNIDRSLPIIPDDPLDKAFLETGVSRLNVFDGDQFDIMTRNDVDMSKIHIGKKKSGYKDAKDMFQDKSIVKQRKDIFEKYNMVSEERADLYSDEYDDTYDDDGHVAVADGTADDVMRRPIVTPRVLRTKNDQPSSSDEYEETEEQPSISAGGEGKKPMDFCVNPELIRERREQNRRIKEKPKKNVDVVGKARGQGQEKEVLLNRDRKNQNKGSRANHNRRAGASWKRGQGMMPS